MKPIFTCLGWVWTAITAHLKTHLSVRIQFSLKYLQSCFAVTGRAWNTTNIANHLKDYNSKYFYGNEVGNKRTFLIKRGNGQNCYKIVGVTSFSIFRGSCHVGLFCTEAFYFLFQGHLKGLLQSNSLRRSMGAFYASCFSACFLHWCFLKVLFQ